MTHDFAESALVGLVILIQCLAVISVGLARFYCRSSVSPGFQATFFVALVAIGAASMASIALGGGLWMAAAVTLPLMAVGATIDLRSHAIRTF